MGTVSPHIMTSRLGPAGAACRPGSGAPAARPRFGGRLRPPRPEGGGKNGDDGCALELPPTLAPSVALPRTGDKSLIANNVGPGKSRHDSETAGRPASRKGLGTERKG